MDSIPTCRMKNLAHTYGVLTIDAMGSRVGLDFIYQSAFMAAHWGRLWLERDRRDRS